MVTSPTRGHNILDLILSNHPGRITNTETIPGISDHCIVACTMNILPLRRTQPSRWILQYHKANWQEMAKELDLLHQDIQDYNTNDPETLWTIIFKDKLNTLVDTHIPKKKTKKIQKLPYITKEIEKLIKRRNRKYKTLKRMRQDLNRSNTNYYTKEEELRALKREIQQKMRKAYWNYIDNIISPEQDDTKENQYKGMKRFWQHIKNNRKDYHGVGTLKSNGRISSTARDKANALNHQFQSVFSPIQDPDQDILGQSQHPIAEDITITEKGILKMLQRLKPHKAAGPDNITARILKELSSSLAPLLQIIFQRSYDTSTVPSDWKKANVVPIYKKGQKSDPANYRPISLTCIICKMMEHIVASNIMLHARTNNIMYNKQHGFMSKRSCETQLLEFQSDILKNLASNQQTDVLVMDFSKAFDKVSHRHLLLKLDHYGVAGKTNAWIKSFLDNREQCVVLEGERSDFAPVTSGVPQGSVLGPCLFLYYINDIADSLKSTVRLFADDTVAYLAIKNQDDASTLQEDLNKLGVWEQRWLMEFHPQKCQVLSITRKQNISHHKYTLHGHELEHVTEAKYLGVTITTDFRWNKHISNTTSKASKSLAFLKRNLQSGSSKIKERAYKAIVRPLVEYAPSIWDPSTTGNKQKIEMIQRRAARYVLNKYNNTSSVTNMLRQLKWTTLENRRKIMRLCLFYKIRNGHVETHSQNEYLQPSNRINRNSNTQAYIIPDSPKDYIKHSFYPRTIRDWNTLPEEVVSAKTTESFKHLLNRHICNGTTSKPHHYYPDIAIKPDVVSIYEEEEKKKKNCNIYWSQC